MLATTHCNIKVMHYFRLGRRRWVQDGGEGPEKGGGGARVTRGTEGVGQSQVGSGRDLSELVGAAWCRDGGGRACWGIDRTRQKGVGRMRRDWGLESG